MFCCISGEIPEEPVVSRTSGLLFEKRLILKSLVATGGKCPETGEPLSEEELIDVKTSGKLSKPTKSTIGNIPNLLAHLQSEYDSIILENHTGKKMLSKTRQELAHALYQYDAATRIIEQLTREKTELENALHKSFETKYHEQHAQVNTTATKRKISLTVNSAGESENGDNDDEKDGDDGEEIEMKVGTHRNAKRRKESGKYKITSANKSPAKKDGNNDSNGAVNMDTEAQPASKDSSLLADTVLVDIEKQSKVLLGERKTRKASPSLEKSSAVKAFTCTAKGLPFDDRQIPAPITCLAFADAGSKTVVGGRTDGALKIMNAETLKTEKIIAKKLGGGISALKRVPAEDRNAVVCGTYNGCVRVIDLATDGNDDDSRGNKSGNGGKVVDLGFHPNGNLVLSVLEHGMWCWTDVDQIGKSLMRRSSGDTSAKYASGSVHGDGILFATGCTNGTTEMWDIRTGKTLAQYKDVELNNSANGVGVTGLDMSENGYYLASAINGTVAIWDLRKHKILRQYEVDEDIMDVAIDYSGTYGAAVTRKKTVLFSTKRKSSVLKTFEHEETNDGIVNSYRPGLLWGENAKFVLSGQSDGCVYRYGSE